MKDTPSLLTGTWPVRTHADRFFGTVKVDGQHPRVAGLICDHRGDVVAISLVGYETSTSAALSSLWLREAVPYLVADSVEWKGPRLLRRGVWAYKQFSTTLPNTKESHALALPSSAHIGEGILHPPDLPTPEEEHIAQESGARRSSGPIALAVEERTRYVLGNWDEETPHQRGFLGTLYGMRVLFLHRDPDHPDWPALWAEALWKRGLARRLIEPLPSALGMKAWKLSGDLDAWGRLTGDGVREGWLPWRQASTSPSSSQEQATALALAR